MNKLRSGLLSAFFLGSSSFAQFESPFHIQVKKTEAGFVEVDVRISDSSYLYAEHFQLTDALGNPQQAVKLPEARLITDPNTGTPKPVFDQSFTALFQWSPKDSGSMAIHVKYWGCNDQLCFIPQTKIVELSDAKAVEEESPAKKIVEKLRHEFRHFEVIGTTAGFMRAKPFLRFLDGIENDGGEVISGFKLFLIDPVAFVRESGLLLTLAFILAGGFSLNLTPCVLPMIPVNLAIIGAGAQAGSKKRGFALGATYGMGMALVYGVLGLAVVFTGSKFGTVQANPWFNLVIAILFLVLALAVFGVFHIDFTRFRSKNGQKQQKKGAFFVALAMGCVAALLAGACVAPVVIAVFLLAASLYEAHRLAGMMIPFILGIGMALPWPFAGAGLSFLPKPGKWMEWVKYGFGIGIIFLALYYGNLSFRTFRPADVNKEGEIKGRLVIDGRTNAGLSEALEQAYAQRSPLFIDFWAKWCKNCKVMDKSTFKDEMVKERLEKYTFIKYVAEDLTQPETQAMMELFGVHGLPTFVVLQAK